MRREKVPEEARPVSSGVLYHPAKVHYDECVRTANDISARLAVNQARRLRAQNSRACTFHTMRDRFTKRCVLCGRNEARDEAAV